MTRKSNQAWRRAAGAALATVLAFALHGQEVDESALEVTIRLLPENAVGPGELTRQIELPPAARGNRDAAAPRVDPASGPPPGAENGLGRGLEIAEEARTRGREFGQDVAEQARENRENAGRPDDAGPPANPGPPGPQGPPTTPPGRP